MISEGITKMEFVFVNTSAENKVSRKETEGTESKDFNSYLKSKDSSEAVQKNETGNVNSKETKFTEYKRLVNEETEKSSDENTITDQTDIISPEVYAQVMESIKQIMGIIQETFGIAESEVEKAISELGMTETDLLNNSGLNELLSKLAPEGNVSSLLVNSDFSNAVKEMYSIINNLKETLKSDFSMTDDDINALIQKMKDSPVQTGTETSVVQESSEETVMVNSATKQENGSNQEITLKVDKAYQPEETESSHSKGNSGNENSSENFSQGLMNKISEALEQSGNTEPEAVKIIKQIINEIKLTVKQDMTKFEMQLNPEHLGKVSLQVVSKDGSITAQIAAGNAAVKEAIENQVVVLKQNLEEQGIKVDSIEVTIASHGFEQNNDKKEEDLGNSSSKKSSTLGKLGGDQSEEETTLAEQLLNEGGSTVSYKA